MYHNNTQLVQDLCQRKEQEGLFKENPDFPESREMTLYWVRVLYNLHFWLILYKVFLRVGTYPLPEVLVEMSVASDNITSEKIESRASGSFDAGSEVSGLY